jgi:hypothetical protein
MKRHCSFLTEKSGLCPVLTDTQYTFLEVKASIDKILSNPRRKEIHLYLLGDKKFTHTIVSKHKKLLPTTHHPHLPASYVNQKLCLKVVLKKEELLNYIEEGKTGLFHIAVVHEPSMPCNIVKDYLISVKIFNHENK